MKSDQSCKIVMKCLKENHVLWTQVYVLQELYLKILFFNTPLYNCLLCWQALQQEWDSRSDHVITI